MFLSAETLKRFGLIDVKMLGQVFSQVNPMTCVLEPIPTSLLKTFYGFFEHELLNNAHRSLRVGVFPAALKKAVMWPLLKNSNLDLDNYWPVSNLLVLSKILEKVLFTQLHDFILKKNIFEKYQSGFKSHRIGRSNCTPCAAAKPR